ncbi:MULTISPECIES: poly-beta-1,6-N-acetyl-D-glucosamine biosynthesis protein PgaD [unclassified Pseudomonas]|uniref:poly-beta-1,6-N-acetyl-D-glucosamine biosynthesis protein PgaD n=1 Tax=unclassified Pseudomonas TaxID=196821 RepID=UPI002AC89AAC|nr:MULTISPECIES: poly-beta-1,6-N-acetyl-D-glucosamine biosynthesis protein PgaD [unclassified Pseudomonas]MEB0047949.1 poly-beta-1,6-N-acetyl-D-glucosamine biosynthesis protein PgaD [Pseudomonas sp. Dout3]MEB0098850.1 poly-beta-1,6-N-acetyl-D-glucosamine biosynthesis protein PgaD [Pseudomonas sp. DC1.2]WPX59124.1 poly-beta-1,6-N-acetyl-D-glucosamine biosynthesis protein PgaD [Pseudomonas sp. DC1.2]
MKIIRTRQRPFLVVLDVFFTVLAWIGLLYLLVRGLLPLFDTHGGQRIDTSFFEALGTLQIYMWVAVVNAVILISWARYQQRKSNSFAQRRLPAPVVDDEGLSKSFKLSGDRLQKLRAPGSMTIHNNQEGDVSNVITHFFPINPLLQPPPLAPLDHPRVIRLPAEE